MKVQPQIEARLNLRKLKAVVMDMTGISETQWFELWAEVKHRGSIEGVYKNGIRVPSLWEVKPFCRLHPTYKAVRFPTSKKPSCTCRAMWDAR